MFFRQNILTTIFVSSLVIVATINYVESGCESRYDPMRENTTLEYLILERKLWTQLTTNVSADKEFLYGLVQKDFIKFLRDYGMLSSDESLYQLPSTIKLKAAVNEVRQSLRLRLHRLLGSDDVKLAEAVQRSDELSTDAIMLAEAIIREFKNPDFWTNSTNVRSIQIKFFNSLCTEFYLFSI